MRAFGWSKSTFMRPLAKRLRPWPKKLVINSLLFSFFPLLPPQAVAAQAPSRELLLFMEVPTVVSASRREQPLTKAPFTTTIITAAEIQRSGATNIPDLFRAVPGLDFMRVTVSDVNITARGLNQRLAHRMQLFIDGRSVNEDFFNMVFWHELPISLQEIERIEIVRSPSSALFGTVAFSGVIQIITKSPDALKGTHFSQTLGNGGINITNIIHAGGTEKFGYKVAFEHDRANQFPDPTTGTSSDHKGRQDYRGNLFAEYKFTENSRTSLTAGIDSFERNIVPGLGLEHGRVNAEGGQGFIKLNYSLGEFKFQSVWDHLDMDLHSPILPKKGSVQGDAFDIDAQHSLKLGAHHIVTGGANYRFTMFDSPFLIGPKREQHYFAAFLQDEYSPMEKLTFTFGLRVYTHPEAGVNVSPRGSVVYSPWENHTFRASISRAIRNPSILENFVNLAVLSPLGTVTVLGDRDLKPEEMVSYELGYQTLLFERLKARVDLFYNHLDDLTLGPVPTGPLELSLSTGGGGSIFGGEISLEFLLTDWLKGFMNYSYQERDINDKRLLGIGARHKGNVGLSFTLPKSLQGDVYVNTVGRSTGTSGTVDPYTLVNLHLGYPFDLWGTKGRLNFAVFNLFNDRHREVPGGDLIERRISGGIQFRF